MDAGPTGPQQRSVTTARLLVAAVVVLVGFVVAGRLGGGPRLGFDTTCRTFLGMSHREQEAVMVQAGVAPAYVDSRIAYYATRCGAHEDVDRPLGEV
jgi:hypothetical protein